MPVAAIGGRHEAAMGAAEKLRGGPTWGPGGGAAAAGSGGCRGGGRGQPGFKDFRFSPDQGL